jgi:hypothetical protein
VTPRFDTFVIDSALPTGAATSAKQDEQTDELISINGHLTTLENYLDGVESKLDLANGSLSSILSRLDVNLSTRASEATLSSIDIKTPALVSGRVPVDGSGVTQPISAAALPLPAGAATSANQTNGTQKTQIVDSAGAIQGPMQVVSGTNYAPVVLAASATNGAALPVRAVLVAGSDGTNARNMSTDTAGRVNVNVINNSSDPVTFQTYSGCVVALAVAANPTDIFTITGSASKTIYVYKVRISGTQNNNGSANFLLVKRSTANTGGTSTTPAIVPHDSANATTTAVVRAYTANPTLGTLVGTLRAFAISIPNKNSIGAGVPLLEFGDVDSTQPIVLRGTSELLAINMNGVSMAGSDLELCFEWREI